ncbi:hypothetical protein HHK36_012111 [Tetracentron sinense]|uniref:Kinesin motor domain-containing protein n=1 Tax=Tetracentron sinense TaxID=13715 RepID=A0A834ZHP1_TETSI|nr:hypothetical protein HHK36_012111 [Tetracentron sinense]
MLVHVSPKEEDLCETICSLNFATRVRNIRLENQESTQEVRDQKEVAMTKLLQKVKQIEYERQDMRRDIDKLNEKIQHLTRTVPTSNGYLKLPHLLNEVPQSNTEMENHSIGDVIAAPSLQLPRFMRPTICSRRKSDTDPQTLESAQKKDSSLPRRRKASSVHAESITFSIKGILEYDSECSTSRTSCLVGLNMKCSTDYGTEYSHDASECDIKTVVFPEQEKSPRRLAHSKDHFSHKSTNRYGNRKANKFYSTKCLTIDNWLHLQRNESTTRTYTHRTKKVLAIPVPEKNNRCNGQNKAEILQCVKVHNHEVTNENIFNHDKIEKLVDVGVTGRSNTEEVIDETWNSGFNIISPFIMTDEKVMEETQGLLGDLMIKDNGCSPISPPDMQYDRLNQNEYSGVTGMTSKQEVTAETQNMSEDFMLEDSGCNPSSPSEMENNIIKLKEESHDPASKPELESGSQQWSTEIPNQAMVGPRRTVVIDDTVLMEITLSNGNMSKEYSDKGDLCAGFQYVEGVTRPCLHTMRSCRVLFMDYANLKDPTTSFIESQERIHNTGIFDFVGQKLKILYASALLGLGVQSLGLGHDFFYGLML